MSFLALPDSCAGSQRDSCCALWGHVLPPVKGRGWLRALYYTGSPQIQARDLIEERDCCSSPPSFAPTLLPQALLECDRSHGQGMSRQ